jgi:hypothetical protein
MILPARIADHHRCSRLDASEKVGAHLERAGAPERLDRRDAAALDGFAVGAEDERAHRVVVGGKTVDRQVALGRRRGQQLLLGRGDAA